MRGHNVLGAIFIIAVLIFMAIPAYKRGYFDWAKKLFNRKASSQKGS